MNEIPIDERIVPVTGLIAAEELAWTIDAAFIVAGEKAPVVQVLLRSPGIKVMSLSSPTLISDVFPSDRADYAAWWC